MRSFLQHVLHPHGTLPPGPSHPTPLLTHEGAVDGVLVEEMQLSLPNAGDTPDEHVLPCVQLHQLDSSHQLVGLAEAVVTHVLREEACELAWRRSLVGWLGVV